MRIVVADDHPLIRAGIRALLKDVPGVTDVFEAADADALQRQMHDQQPDVVLLDAEMSGRAEGLLRLRQRHPDVLIIFLSANTEEESARHALEAGASGILAKEDVITELRHAIATVDAGRSYISPSIRVKGSLVHEFPLAGLTPRQREILKLIARGLTNRQIAAALGVHIKTVETHRTDLMRRLGIHNVAGLVRYAIRHGLLPTNDE
ncbi:MAG TPA: response regulator transcription factor [Thermoanaerobaculia bacterium]|nr:response regulator transcription factor [Thermoanaerobaculia bacterium]